MEELASDKAALPRAFESVCVRAVDEAHCEGISFYHLCVSRDNRLVAEWVEKVLCPTD